MELLDLLERRIGDLLQQLQSLREENARLVASTETFAQMREENRVLSESLEKERALHKEIATRIEALLAGIDDHEKAQTQPQAEE